MFDFFASQLYRCVMVNQSIFNELRIRVHSISKSLKSNLRVGWCQKNGLHGFVLNNLTGGFKLLAIYVHEFVRAIVGSLSRKTVYVNGICSFSAWQLSYIKCFTHLTCR